MNLKRVTLWMAVLALSALVFAACAAPASDSSTGAEPAATEAPAEEAAADADAVAYAPTSVGVDDCEYGGKIQSIEATDSMTVQFNLCKPDPAFLAKVAFIPFGIQPAEHIAATGGTGELLENPIGTGPYSVENWERDRKSVV